MYIKRLAVGLLALLGFWCGPLVVQAAPPPNISGSYAICNPNYPKQCALVDASGNIPTTGGGGGGGNASVGTTGTTAPTSGTLIGGKSVAGNLVAGCVDTAGVLCAPQATTTQRILTATNLSSNTSTTICPTATNPVTTEIFFTTSGVGVGFNGQTLTSATPGATTTNSPDIAIGTANTLYTFPVGPSNAITAYGAAGIIRCIQTLRQ